MNRYSTMCRWILLIATSLAIMTACGPPVAGRSHLVQLKAAIRQDAEARYGAECGSITIDDEAFLPVEVTGDERPELAVTFARVRCGESLSRFSGTGGVVVQFWTGSGNTPRLLLEQQMHGFTPSAPRLITMQHGSYCPDGAGPDQCRITYEWNARDRNLDVVQRVLASRLERLEPMQFDYERLTRRTRR